LFRQIALFNYINSNLVFDWLVLVEWGNNKKASHRCFLIQMNTRSKLLAYEFTLKRENLQSLKCESLN